MKSKPSEFVSLHPIGSVLEATVSEVRPFGFVCELKGSSSRGVIKFWEWTWDQLLTQETAKEQSAKYLGQTRRCVVVGYDQQYAEVFLSPRKARPEEWHRATAGIEPGRTLLHGEVIGTDPPDLFFVRLDRGVVGQLPNRFVPELPGLMTRAPLVGDRICAVTEEIDPERFAIRLNISRAVKIKRNSLRDSLAGGSLSASLAEIAGNQVSTMPFSSFREFRDETELLDSHPIVKSSVGWVEDQPEKTADLRTALLQMGVRVVELPIASRDLLARLRLESHDLYVVDIDLGAGISGIDLMQTAMHEHLIQPDQILFLTGVGARSLRAARELEPLDILSKGKDNPSLFRYVRGLPPVRNRFASLPDDESEGTSEMSLATEAPVDPTFGLRRFEMCLEAIAQRSGARGAYLMQYEPSAGFVLEAEWPPGSTASDPHLLSRLLYSPLADVIRTGHPYFETRCSDHAKRFESLIPVWGPPAGLAVSPVLTFGRKSHVFVIFADDPERLPPQEIVGDHARHIETLLENRALSEINVHLEKAARTGMVAVGIVHDLKNRIMPISGTLALSKRHTLELLRRESPPTPADSSRWFEYLGKIEKEVHGLIEPLERLLNIVKLREPPFFDPMKSLEGVIDNIRMLDDTKQANVDIRLECPDLARTYRGSSLAFEQIVFNLLLNAVQQIGMTKDGAGLVTVRAQEASAGGSQALLIQITDTGPGIHTRDFARLFEFGFTTRPKGSGTGIGLYHVKRLAKVLAASVEVQESTLFFGSTFRIVLPSQ